MKILQVYPYFYPAWGYGGVTRVVYEVSRHLVGRGYEVTVYATDALDNKSRVTINSNSTYIDGNGKFIIPDNARSVGSTTFNRGQTTRRALFPASTTVAWGDTPLGMPFIIKDKFVQVQDNHSKWE